MKITNGKSLIYLRTGKEDEAVLLIIFYGFRGSQLHASATAPKSWWQKKKLKQHWLHYPTFYCEEAETGKVNSVNAMAYANYKSLDVVNRVKETWSFVGNEIYSQPKADEIISISKNG